MIHWEGHPRSFGKIIYSQKRKQAADFLLIALHYPYVLAFEPTFVEIRHVETGVLTQIIQGNNLRCLYAEAPPSTTHVKSNVYPGQNGHMPNSYGYDPRQSSYSDRSSLYSMSSGSMNHHGSPAYGQPMNAGASQYGLGNREIIMVSDDRVMVIQLAQHTS